MYRLGVVYILSDNSLSPVFNIRGANEIPETGTENHYYEEPLETNSKRNYLQYDEETGLLTPGKASIENVKGVIRINDTSNEKLDGLYSIEVYIPEDVKNYLQNNLKIKGLFFVR
jgi:hypothetical protein